MHDMSILKDSPSTVTSRGQFLEKFKDVKKRSCQSYGIVRRGVHVYFVTPRHGYQGNNKTRQTSLMKN